MAAQLRDEFGNPVHLTDEHGVPVHVTGIATHERPTVETVIKGAVMEETGFLASTTAATGRDALKGSEPSVEHAQGELMTDVKDEGSGEIQRSSSSSSGSSEDDGEGGRRKKKKGLRQKLKEKLNIGKHKEEQQAEQGTTATVGGGTEDVQQHEKKSVIEKIKEKLPGHHTH